MIETGISFGNIHSFRDLDLILSSVEIPPASPKETYVDIPGANGSVDMTEALGEVKYSDRTGAKFTFYMNPDGDLSESAWEAKKKEISNRLNGLRCNITLDKDPSYYWQGRCKVNDHTSDRKKRKFVVGARLAPYKLKTDMTRVFIPFSGKNLFDNADLPLIGGSGCDVSTIDTGVRATWRSGTYSYMVVRWLPVQMLIGKTITISATITKSGGAQAYLRIGYTNADGSDRIAKTKLYGTGQTTLTIGADAANFEYLAVWFYATNGETATEGAFVDYADLQIELADTATGYEPFAANPDQQEVTLVNARKTVCPTIICTGETTLTVAGGEYALSEGTHKVLDLQLHEGDTPVTVSGAGAVAFVYQEGDL